MPRLTKMKLRTLTYKKDSPFIGEFCYNDPPLLFEPCSPVAQLVEQPAVNRLVAGSSPARGAI
jgi:hypothetical protein